MAVQNQKPIREIGISEFGEKCVSLLDEAAKTKLPLRVTRRGKPIADVIPVTVDESCLEKKVLASVLAVM